MSIETITFPRDNLAEQLSLWLDQEAEYATEKMAAATENDNPHAAELEMRRRFSLPSDDPTSVYGFYGNYYTRARLLLSNGAHIKGIQAAGKCATNASDKQPLLGRIDRVLDEHEPALIDLWMSPTYIAVREQQIRNAIAISETTSDPRIQEQDFKDNPLAHFLASIHLEINAIDEWPEVGSNSSEARKNRITRAGIHMQQFALSDWVSEIHAAFPGDEITLPVGGQAS